MNDKQRQIVKKNFIHAKRGNNAAFIPLNENVAAKIFFDASYREVKETFDFQKEAFKYEAAPDCYDIFDFPVFNSTLWGYTTEIVKVIPTISTNGVRQDYLYSKRKFTEKERVDLTELKDKLTMAGIPGYILHDLFEFNIGWKRFSNNDTMVCIDFF